MGTNKGRINFIFFFVLVCYHHWQVQDVGPWWSSATLIGLFETVTEKKQQRRKKKKEKEPGSSSSLGYWRCALFLCVALNTVVQSRVNKVEDLNANQAMHVLGCWMLDRHFHPSMDVCLCVLTEEKTAMKVCMYESERKSVCQEGL